MEKQKIYLASENSDYPPLVITDLMDFEVWGVVTNVIHPL
jgi:DNA polymerase V